MSELTHCLQYNYETKVYECRYGACSFKVAEEAIEDSQYQARKAGVIFVKESDFDTE